MNAPKPMATPNLADLLAKKPHAPLINPPEVKAAGSPITASRPLETREDEKSDASLNTELDEETIAAVAPPQSRDVAAGEQREYLRSIALYLPRTLHQQLGSVATELGTTRTNLILDAINSTHSRLGPALSLSSAPARGQDLFSVPQSKPDSEPSVQTTIRVTDAQHAAIARLVTEHRTNRSRLIAAALHLHLPAS